VFLDYLNLIAPEKASAWSDNRRMDIMELTYRARSLGLDQGCPVVLAVQSKRESNERVWKLPQKWDALEASAIEQYSDTMLSLWLPATTEPITTPPLKLKGPDGEPTDIEITRNLLIMGVNKQKKGPAGGWYALYVDPTRNVIEPLERRAASAPPVYGGRDDAFDLG
jgi:replicative DNA helicase